MGAAIFFVMHAPLNINKLAFGLDFNPWKDHDKIVLQLGIV